MPEPLLDRIFADTPVLVAYLFGSHAVGRAGPTSDRDIAVLIEPGSHNVSGGAGGWS
jgi:predicted nucleotidyltransferase